MEDDHIPLVCFLILKNNINEIFYFLVTYDEKLYIFGGYNSVLGSHYNDLYEFNPLTLSWRSVKTRGIGKPVPRRRQCCLVINNRMYMFGGTSPISTSTIPNN